MIGQLHYVIARTDGHAYRYWRSRGNQSMPSGWVYDMAAARKYRRPGDALSAAQQIAKDPGDEVEVLELQIAVRRVCYRLSTHSVVEEMPS